ncbi:MAG: endonuclease/exonuclease/phosphatase family protein [Pseudomonadota bacterium]
MQDVAVALAVLFVLSHGGALHPALDTLAVFRLPLAAALVACLSARALRRRRWVQGAALAGIATIALDALFWDRGPGAAGDMRLYQKNLWFGNENHAEILRDIAARAPDIITFQEVSPTNRPLLAALSADYPEMHVCDFGPLYSIAVLSRLPRTGTAPLCSEDRGFAALEIAGPNGPGWIVSIHLEWPWPFEQPAQIALYTEALAALEGSVIVAGDFNQVPWSHTVRTLSRVTGAGYRGPHRATFSVGSRVFERPPLFLPIDHVLAPRGEVTRLTRIGSDHAALIAIVGF